MTPVTPVTPVTPPVSPVTPPVSPVAPVTPTPSPAANSGMVLNVHPDFAAQLGDEAAFADCYLSPEEIATSPAAAAFALAFRQQTADSLGLPLADVTLNGISTDGDATPGCADSGSAAESGMTMNIHPDFAAQLGDEAAFADCFLTPEEIATSPAAAAFALAFRMQVAASLGVPVEDVALSGISTDGDNTPGCAGSTPTVTQTVDLDVTAELAAVLGDSAALSDCYLSTEELNADPNAAAFALALIQAQAAAAGLDPAQVSLDGIVTDGDPTPGCQGGESGRRRLGDGYQPQYSSKLAVLCGLDLQCSVHLSGHLL